MKKQSTQPVKIELNSEAGKRVASAANSWVPGQIRCKYCRMRIIPDH